MAPELKFRFDVEKFSNALAYFASQGVTDLTKLKAVKLLYLADQRHLLRYGRPITGDKYIAMDLGPVPESAFQLIGDLLSPVEVEEPAREQALKRICVYRGMFKQYRYPVLRAKTKPDLDVFSDSEVEVLDQTLAEFGKRQARALVDLTHEHTAYKRADADREPGSSVALPYEYFFFDAAEDPAAVRHLAESEQEDRNFADALQHAGREALTRRKEVAAR
jgi:uncharacterized phage-associated protein